MQYDDDRVAARGHLHTNADARYRFWGIAPTPYPVPHDRPVGGLLSTVVCSMPIGCMRRPSVGTRRHAFFAKAAFGIDAVTASGLPRGLRVAALDLLACLHMGDLDEATGVVLDHCPDLAAGPRLVAFASAVAAQLAESFQAVEIGYAGQLGPGLEMDGDDALVAVSQLLGAVVDHDEAAVTRALNRLAGAGVEVMSAVRAVIALATATLFAVAGEAQLHGENLPQLVQRVRRRWT